MRRTLLLLSAIVVGLTPAAFLSQAQASDKYVVTMKASDTSILYGEKFKLTGKVSPNAAGKTVILQYLYVTGDEGATDEYTFAKQTTVKSDGTYSFTVLPSPEGYDKWRVYKAAGSGHAAGASKPITVKPYGWVPLANAEDSFPDIQTDTTGGLGRFGQIHVAGNAYEKYWESTNEAGGKTSWEFNGQCKQIVATFGLDDDSASSARAHIKLYAHTSAGTTQIFDKGVLTSTHDRIKVNVSTATDLFTIKATRNYDTLATYAVAANPKALCTHQHVA